MPSSLAPIALSTPAVVEEVLLHLAHSAVPTDAHHIVGLEHGYAPLRTAAFVNRTWRGVAQRLLQQNLVFTSGVRVAKWLEAVEKIVEEERYPNYVVVLHDKLPFKPEKEYGDGGKWSYEAIERLLRTVKGTKSLWILLLGQKEVPGKWLAGENLQDVQSLIFGAPLTSCGTSPSSSLTSLTVMDSFPAHLSRDWTASFAILQEPSKAASLKSLDLRPFPLFAKYALALVPFAPSLHALSLPVITFTADLWRVCIFAQACTNLRHLFIQTVSGIVSEVLLAFPATLPHIHLDLVIGDVAAALPVVVNFDEEILKLDTWGTLTRTLGQMEGLRFLHIGKARVMSIEQHSALVRLAEEKGFKLKIDYWNPNRTEEEKKELLALRDLAFAKEQHNKQHPKDKEYRPLKEGQSVEDVQ